MSILSSVELGGRSTTADTTFQRTHTRRWRVTSDSVTDDGFAVMVGGALVGPSPVPLKFSPHPTDPYAYAKKLTATEESQSFGQKTWIVQAEYDTSVDPNQNEENPLDRPGIDEWSFAQFQTIADKDKDGDAITTEPGEVFDPPIDKDASNLVLSYSRNEANFPVSLAVQYQDAINSDSFLGVAQRKVKCQSIQATKVFEGEYVYYQCRYEFHFRAVGWQKEILHRGTLVRPGAGQTPVQLPPGSDPVLLAADGTRLPDGDPAEYITKYVYEELPFSTFNITI